MTTSKPADDPYAPIVTQMRADNERAIARLLQSGYAIRAEAAAELAAAKTAFQKLQTTKGEFAAKCAKKHRAHLDNDLRRRVQADIAEQLLMQSTPPDEVAALLDLRDEVVREIASRVAFSRAISNAMPVLIGGELARLEYEDCGRGDYVILHWGATKNRFWREFGTGNTLSFIEIPTAVKWECETGIPLQNRAATLEYIGRKTARDQGKAENHFRIEEKCIVLLRELDKGGE